MTLYKGPVIDFIRSQYGAAHHGASNESGNQHRLAGTLMLLGSCCAWAGFFILQVSIDFSLLLIYSFLQEGRRL